MKVELLEVEEELYEAIKEENFLQAETLKEKLKALKEEVNRLSKVQEAVITDDTREEKSDSVTMLKCLNILYNTIQSIRVLTPTLRSLMSLVLSSLDVSIFYIICITCVYSIIRIFQRFYVIIHHIPLITF